MIRSIRVESMGDYRGMNDNQIIEGSVLESFQLSSLDSIILRLWKIVVRKLTSSLGRGHTNTSGSMVGEGNEHAQANTFQLWSKIHLISSVMHSEHLKRQPKVFLPLLLAKFS